MKEIVIKGLDEKIYEHETPEGLKIYIWQNTKLKGSYMTLSVPYGSIHTHFKVNNKTYKVPNGTAHFLEHIKFNVDKNTTAHDLFKACGGEPNAFTTYKFTSYIVYALDNTKENLEVLLDYVYTPYFTKSIVAKEKGIIVEEANSAIDDAYAMSYFDFQRQIFHKYNYRNLITGEPNDINSITIDDVTNVFNSFYHPANMFLVVTGNVNPYEIVKITEENLSQKEFKEFVKPKIISVKEEKSVVKKHQELEKDITAAEFKYALKIPRSKFKKFNDKELRVYLYLFNQINFGMTSNLKETLREKELITNFNSSFNFTDDYVILNISSLTDYPKEVEKAIDEKLQNLEIPEKDFNRKRKAEIANLILRYENITDVNESIQNNLIVYGKVIDNVKEIYENLSITKMEEIAKLITMENKATLIIRPIKK